MSGVGSLCGGVISQEMHEKNIKKHGIWADMMSFILPNKQYKRYLNYKKKGKDKEAKQVFDKFAISLIG